MAGPCVFQLPRALEAHYTLLYHGVNWGHSRTARGLGVSEAVSKPVVFENMFHDGHSANP